MSLKNKTAFISGASRGIGKAMALKLAAAGVHIIIAAKSIVENEKLGGTIFSVQKEIEETGGQALAIPCDIRDEGQIQHAIEKGVDRFGGIDIVINNASAVSLTDTNKTSAKKFDLMSSINVRGSFLVVKHALPFLNKSSHAHILTLSPPLNLQPKWLGPHVAYTLSKYGMTLLALGWAEEFKQVPIASNTLWPRTTIDTAAVRNLLGGEAMAKSSRKPSIVADAALFILKNTPDSFTGKSLIDEDVLREQGIENFDSYAVQPGTALFPDLFLD